MSSQVHQHSQEFDPGTFYQEQWVQDLIRDLQDFFKTNREWIGLGSSEPLRVLDYACGNGTVSAVSPPSQHDVKSRLTTPHEALAPLTPTATFRGIDVSQPQVSRFNQAARDLLGEEEQQPGRMFAVQGNLNDRSPALDDPEWFGFDVAITSLALHHVADPAEMLKRLKERVRKGGVVVVADFLHGLPLPLPLSLPLAENGKADGGKEPYRYSQCSEPARMVETIGGQRIWDGFTVESIRECMEAAGLTGFGLRLHPGLSKMPERLGGDKQIFYAKASV